MNPIAWGYFAVSSAPQESTLGDQHEWAQQTARERGWILERSFSATASGHRGLRKHLAQMIAELRATPQTQRPAWILMLRLDRLGRGSAIDSQVALREITQLGTRVWTRDQGEVKLNSAMDELIAAATLAVSRHENDIRREKSLAFHARKKAAGEWPSACAYGFVLVDKRLAAYEPEAVVIREIFEKRVAGWGYQRLAQHIAAIAPGKMRPNGARRKIGWSTSTVNSMLKNPVYRGSIVSESLWDAAAALRGQVVDRRAPRWPWPLRTAVRCTCGAQLLGEASGREGARTRYYVCRRFQYHQEPRYPHHNAIRMEAQFVALLGELEATPALAANHVRQPTSLDDLRRRRADLGRQRSALERRRSRAWELAEDGEIARGDLAARLEEFNRESERLGAAAAEIERELAASESNERSARDVAEVFAGAAAIWGRAPIQSQRQIARAVAAYLGGLWADPKRPGRLLWGIPAGGDGARESFDTLRNVDMAQRKADILRSIVACERLRISRETAERHLSH